MSYASWQADQMARSVARINRDKEQAEACTTSAGPVEHPEMPCQWSITAGQGTRCGKPSTGKDRATGKTFCVEHSKQMDRIHGLGTVQDITEDLGK